MTFGSLFAGIGGFDLGLERAGMRCIWQVEIDKNCLRVLRERWPSVERHEDVREVGKANLAPVDLICGGFPCQDLSVAGRGAGLAGERSGLWEEFRRVVHELRPEWVLVENVPGLLSSNERRDMGAVLGGLAELGYMGAYRVLNAQYFGLAQRRRRVFIVGSLGTGRACEILFDSASLQRNPPTRRKARARVAAPSATGVGTCGADDNQAEGGHLIPIQEVSSPRENRQNGLGVGDEGDPMFTLQAGHQHGVAFQQNTRDEVRLVGGDGSHAGALAANAGMKQTNYICTEPVAFDTTQVTSALNRSAPKPGDPCHQLASGTHAPAVAACLSPGHEGKSSYPGDGGTINVVSHVSSVRRLTPTECCRLQGFPDDWLGDLSDSAKYRALGNAVAVPVAEWIGRRLAEVVKE